MISPIRTKTRRACQLDNRGMHASYELASLRLFLSCEAPTSQGQLYWHSRESSLKRWQLDMQKEGNASLRWWRKIAYKELRDGRAWFDGEGRSERLKGRNRCQMEIDSIPPITGGRKCKCRTTNHRLACVTTDDAMMRLGRFDHGTRRAPIM